MLKIDEMKYTDIDTASLETTSGALIRVVRNKHSWRRTLYGDMRFLFFPLLPVTYSQDIRAFGCNNDEARYFGQALIHLSAAPIVQDRFRKITLC